jgi:hypothetical protein
MISLELFQLIFEQRAQPKEYQTRHLVTPITIESPPPSALASAASQAPKAKLVITAGADAAGSRYTIQ